MFISNEEKRENVDFKIIRWLSIIFDICYYRNIAQQYDGAASLLRLSAVLSGELRASSTTHTVFQTFPSHT